MKVFVTGATGFVGSSVVLDLLQAGHNVVGLARSDAAAKSLEASGAKVLRGDLSDAECLRRGAAESDGVIHTGFIHDFSNIKHSCEIEDRAIEAFGSALVGSNRPIVITSGTALVSPGRVATEDMASPKPLPAWPRASEEGAARLAAKGVKASVVRLSPSVHGDGDHGFVPILIGIAREKGSSAYIGEGQNRWTAVHRLDAGPLYRLTLEKGTTGARYHGVAEDGIPFRRIAEAIGKKLNLPVVSKPATEADAHFGWFARFAAIDCPASNQITRKSLGWNPTHHGLIEDLERGSYFKK